MAPQQALIGICGFAERQARLFEDFAILEVQQTFYQPPQVITAQRWRARAPADFVFTIKAWQLITHLAGSPTYRRLREPLSDAQRADAGHFQWNALTRRAWERTLAIAEALDAQAILFQTASSFTPTDENLRRLRHFFETIDRRGRRLVFEPRGAAWRDALLGPLLEELDLIHGVDPFLRPPLERGLYYLRLHGQPAYHYQYRYTDADLHALGRMLSPAVPNWVLFNNAAMAADARRFMQLMGRES